ncbi:hypothetical protein GCM10020256_32310 [Streptomyces thermocoprophilus]
MPGGGAVVFRVLLPLCLVMTFAYIGDSTVSNWSAKYLQDVLGSSEQLATVPYNVYMVTTLLGRSIGDFGVRRFGAAAVVRAGAVVAAGGFAVVAGAPGAWPGMLGFTLVGLGLCVLVPQTFAAAGRLFPGGVGRGGRPAERLQLCGVPGRFAVGGGARRRVELSRGDAGADGVGAGDTGVRPVVRRSTGPIRWRA